MIEPNIGNDSMGFSTQRCVSVMIKRYTCPLRYARQYVKAMRQFIFIYGYRGTLRHYWGAFCTLDNAGKDAFLEVLTVKRA